MTDESQKEDRPDAPPGHGSGADAGDGTARRLRVTRRRLLLVGGAALAGTVAAVAGVQFSRERSGASGRDAAAGASPGAGPGVPGGDFPVLSVEPPPEASAEEWVLKVDGLVEHELTVDRAAWRDLARSTVTADFDCVTGWTADDLRWGGVAPSLLLERAGPRPDARAVVFHAYGHLGGGYTSSLLLDLVTEPRTLLADTLDGAPLPAKHGGPLRLVVPAQLGYKSVKWVVRLEVTDAPAPGYWERRGYPQDAPVTSS